MTEIKLLNVFTHKGAGGNPCPTVIGASALPEQNRGGCVKLDRLQEW
jgi:hypothetical protein